MFLGKDERILILLYRIEKIRAKTLLGRYKSYDIGENKIRKIKSKIEKLGGNANAVVQIK